MELPGLLFKLKHLNLLHVCVDGKYGWQTIASDNRINSYKFGGLLANYEKVNLTNTY